MTRLVEEHDFSVFETKNESSSAAASEKKAMNSSRNGLAEFEQDFSSRILMTYRKGFEAIGDSKLTSDVNWGCAGIAFTSNGEILEKNIT